MRHPTAPNNLPPGCYESDPNAPWNQEDEFETGIQDIVDWLHYTLKRSGYEYDYDVSDGCDKFYVEDYEVVIKVEEV